MILVPIIQTSSSEHCPAATCPAAVTLLWTQADSPWPQRALRSASGLQLPARALSVLPLKQTSVWRWEQTISKAEGWVPGLTDFALAKAQVEKVRVCMVHRRKVIILKCQADPWVSINVSTRHC